MPDPLRLAQRHHSGTCAAMRCKTPTTLADAVIVEALAPGPFELCAVHLGRAISDHGAAAVIRAGAAHAPSIEPLPGTAVSGAALVLAPGPELEAREVTAEAEGLLAEIAAFEIEGQADLDLAAEALVENKARAKKIDEREKAITRPLNEALKSARALFAPAKAACEKIDSTLKSAIAAFHERQAEHNRAALAVATEASAAGDTAAVAAAVATMGSTANVSGVSIRYTFEFEIVDPAAVPREYCAPVPALVREAMRAMIDQCRAAEVPDEEIAGLLELPGVTFARVAGAAVRG